MSTLGPLMFRKSGAAWDNDRTVGLSEETARRVDEEVRQIVMRGYETARQIVQDWRPALQAAASELLEVESLEGSEFKQILARCGAQGAVTPEAGSLPAGAAVISAPDAI
jgi:cell division protease FtsH